MPISIGYRVVHKMKTILRANAQKRYPAWDLLRGIAALAVVMEHTRTIFFVVPEDGINGWGSAAFYFLTGLGRQAVIAFFVLSGAAVGAGVIRDVALSRFSWPDYMFRRLSRLWVVLLPALLLGFLLDSAGLWSGNSMYFESSSLMKSPVAERVGVATLAGNVFFLQTIAVKIAGSNMPLWSLAYEFWYYLFFPMVMLLIFGGSTFGSRVLYGLFCLLLICFLPTGLLGGGVIWLMGAIAVGVGKRTFSPKTNVICFGVVVAGVSTWLLLEKAGFLPKLYAVELGLGLLMAVLIWILRDEFWHSLLSRLRLGKITDVLSLPSYTLYLTHFPLFFLVASLSGLVGRLEVNTYGMAVAMLVLLLAYVWAWGNYLLFERNTDYVKQRVKKWRTRNSIGWTS